MPHGARIAVAIAAAVLGSWLVFQSIGWAAWTSNAHPQTLCYELEPSDVALVASENTCVSTRYELIPLRVVATYETRDGRFIERNKENALGTIGLYAGAGLLLVVAPISLLLARRRSSGKRTAL